MTPLDAYLADVRRSMVGMDPHVREDILRELGSHLAESSAANGGSAAVAITEMGPPEQVGRGYREIYGYGLGFRSLFAAVAAVLAVLTAPVLTGSLEAATGTAFFVPNLLAIPTLVILIGWLLWVSVRAGSSAGLLAGLAAGIAGVASAFFFILAVIEGLGLVASLAAATLGACVAFLYYNFTPATLFMGDAGSMLLGFVLAVLGIKLEFKSIPLQVTWMIPIVILGVPIFDTTLVVISRLRGRRPVYLGGKDHLSHRLVTLFTMTQTRAVMTLYLVASALGLLAIIVRDATPLQAQVLAVVLAVIFIVGLIWLERRFKLEQTAFSEPSTPH